MFRIKTLTYVLSLFKKMPCNFVLFIKTNKIIYKNSIMQKTCFHRGFEFFKENLFIKKRVEQSQNKRV